MKTILACTDLSDHAHQALVRAIALAAEAQASLTILHAASEDDGTLDETRQAIETFARGEAEAIGAAGLPIQVRLRTQDPRQAIPNEAAQCGARLIVLGGHGEPRFRDAIFGTVGTHVVRHSGIPVLIVQTDPALSYAKLLVAADTPESARRLVECGLGIAPSAEVFTVHAYTVPLAQGLFCRDASDETAARQGARFEAGLAPVADANPRAGLTADGHVIVAEGDALTVMMDKTDELLPDLLVMGTHQGGTFVGSRGVDAMFWCPADMLIMPEPVAAPADA